MKLLRLDLKARFEKRREERFRQAGGRATRPFSDEMMRGMYQPVTPHPPCFS